ncbi:MipA/OmpV family protein [Blastomonas sp.]|uniref:MipA/OmpV family protein n=1 Tax=Blastomonas sp. TaxID=1909299 RepID=UPI0026217A8F|nr:MipA/OmpV family protein [Blastomonas sp.]MDM7955170.1 MipA/OmpV family protein [Blastomonas sp.]
MPDRAAVDNLAAAQDAPSPAVVVTARPQTTAARPYGPTDEELELLAFGARLSQSVFAQEFTMTVGLGAGLVPSYEGSNQYVFFPAPVIQGNYKGYAFAARGPGLFVDLVKDPLFPKVEYIAGPIIRARFDRVGRIRDTVVKQLGDRNIAVEVGASGGFKVNRIFDRFDSLTFQVDALHDIAGAHSGAIVTPSVSYNKLLGTKGVINLSVSGDLIDRDFADYYFTIDAAGSAASGLPAYRAGGGLKSLGASALLGFDLSGDALDGGWGVFVLGSYSRLQGDAADSPIVSIRGDANQYFGGAGLTYTF